MSARVVVNPYPEWGFNFSWVQCAECGSRKRLTGFWVDLGRKSLVVHWRTGRCRKCRLPY